MEEWADTFENFRRIGCRKITVGSYKTGRLLCIAGLDIKWGGYPEYDISMIVRLLTISPKYDKRSVGFETLHLLQELGQANALQLDCSNLKEIPSLRFFVLGSAKTLGADPEVLNPRQLCYKKYVKKSTFVLDNVPDWADLGPFWFEGTTQDGVSFWFRKRTPTLLNEFQICWDHPEVGNSTGIGTVGGARVIGLDKSLKCEDIRGWAKIEEIRANLSLKIESEVKKSENLNNSDESA